MREFCEKIKREERLGRVFTHSVFRTFGLKTPIFAPYDRSPGACLAQWHPDFIEALAIAYYALLFCSKCRFA